jgi:hypothetical protein
VSEWSADDELFSAVAALGDGVGAGADVRGQLTALCDSARLAFGAAAVSVARVTGDADAGLVYEAAAGEGADATVGLRLAAGVGIAGFVAATGQALALDRVSDDPRWAREVAESTGFVPTSLLVVPVTTDSDDVSGVLSVLDRTHRDGAEALALASSFAHQAGLLLPSIDVVARLGPMLLRAIADALDAGSSPEADGDVESAAERLAASLRRAADTDPGVDADLARTAARLTELRSRSSETRAAVERVLDELLALTEPRRRR